MSVGPRCVLSMGFHVSHLCCAWQPAAWTVASFNCFKATIWDIPSGWFLPQPILNCYTQRVPNSTSGLRGKPLLRRTGNQTWPYRDEMAYFSSLYLRNVFSLTLVRMSIEGHTCRLVLVVQRGSWSSRMTFQQLSWVDLVELGNTDPHKHQVVYIV